jgi:hypothetical protein
MAKSRTTTHALPVDAAPDHTGGPAFTRCARCGALVLTRGWSMERGWRTFCEAVTPVLGKTHQCSPQTEGEGDADGVGAHTARPQAVRQAVSEG